MQEYPAGEAEVKSDAEDLNGCDMKLIGRARGH